MPAAPIPVNESSRIRALHALEVLDSAPEPEFDALVNAAALVCGVPFSTITLIDTDRQWFKAGKGMRGVTGSPRSISFCAHTILGQDVLEVPDATLDPQFSDNPIVTSGPGIRFYAGAPLTLSDGHRVGTLCVSGCEPRQLDAIQRAILQSLAVVASRALEGRKAVLAQQDTLRELHKSELLLDRTGRLAQVGGWEVDLRTGKNEWTDETRRIHGVPADYEPTVEKAISFYAAEARPAIAQAVSKAIADGSGWDLELPFIRHDGGRIWVRAVGAVETEGGKAVRLVGALQDITARRNADLESQKNALLLRSAIDIIDEAFVVCDPQDRLVLCNDKYREVYATSAPMIMPGNTFEQIIRYGVEKGQYLAAIGREEEWIAQRLASHRQSNITQVQKLNDGRRLRVLERKLPDGHIVGFRVDITDLVRATEAAEQASNAKGQFLANMSHEIRTPMNAMLGMLTLLRKTPLTPQQTDYVSKSEGATRLLLGVINDILDYSKIEAGHLTLDNQPFDMQPLVQDLQVMLSASAGGKPVKVTYQLDLGLPQRLVGDAMRLQQVLVNLGSNAIKFTPQGQVQISIKLKERTQHTATLEVAVSDTGVGIAPENQARIFDGFSQAEASTTRRFGGTGLGLTISQRLVAQMGGELKVVSVLGQGSRFYFSLTLPYLPAALVTESTPSAALSPRLVGMRLLLVEDNPASQQVARELLQLEGAVVQVAGDGHQAIEAIEARRLSPTPFDLVLMDIQMPVMDGLTATHHIRHAMGLKDLPIVAMTANALESDRKACLAAGMNAHIAKPFDLDHVVGVLRQLAQPGWTMPTAPPQKVPPLLGQSPPAPATAPDRAQPPAEAVVAAQDAGVDLDTALMRLGHNLPIYSRALRSFIADLATLPSQLDALLAAAEVNPAASTLHKLKGLASTLGVNALADAARQGEARLKGASAEQAATELAAVVAQMSDAIHRVLPQLVNLLKLLQASPAPPEPIAQRARNRDVGLTLQALASKLQNFDMDALPLMNRLKQAWGPSPTLQLLEDAIDALDFEEALRVCQSITQDASP